MEHTFWIRETVSRVRVYHVEADSKEEAKELALKGETVHETQISYDGVINRELLE